MTAAIYVIKNKVNNKIYIGSSIQVEQRWKEHVWALNINKHVNPHLQHSWTKYGVAAFEFKVIEIVDDPSKTLEREQSYLDIYFNSEPERLYNIKRQAHGGGQPLSDAAKQSISEKNRKFSDEELSQIKQLYEDGMFQKDIAEKMNVNKMTINLWINKMHKEGTVRKPQEIRKEKVLELFSKGITQKEIAISLSISPSSVSQILHGGYSKYKKRKE